MAFIGGVIRTRLGGVLIMLLVWLIVFPILALSVFGMAMNVGQMMEEVEGEATFGLVPPIPEGMTLTRLLETPMLGEIAMDMLDMFGEGLNRRSGWNSSWGTRTGRSLGRP